MLAVLGSSARHLGRSSPQPGPSPQRPSATAQQTGSQTSTSTDDSIPTVDLYTASHSGLTYRLSLGAAPARARHAGPSMGPTPVRSAHGLTRALSSIGPACFALAVPLARLPVLLGHQPGHADGRDRCNRRRARRRGRSPSPGFLAVSPAASLSPAAHPCPSLTSLESVGPLVRQQALMPTFVHPTCLCLPHLDARGREDPLVLALPRSLRQAPGPPGGREAGDARRQRPAGAVQHEGRRGRRGLLRRRDRGERSRRATDESAHRGDRGAYPGEGRGPFTCERARRRTGRARAPTRPD
jgi:hypothetical protein